MTSSPVLPMPSGGPVVIEASKIVRDISERKHAERAVNEYQARKSAILDAALDGVVTMDHAGRIVDFSRAAERMFGYSAAEVVGKTVAETIIPKRLRQEHWNGLARFHQTGEGAVLGRRIAIIGMRADGTEFPVELAISTTHLPDQPVFFTAFIRDLTEQKRNEQALLAAKEQLANQALELEHLVTVRTAELRSSIAELEAFTYSLSHDLRAPLRAMQSFSQILMADCREKLGSSELELLEKIASASARLDRLITDVLAFSRSSHEEIQVERVDVERLIRDVIKERPEWSEAHAEVVIESPLHPMLGHEASFTQCLTNLVENAVKFVPQGRKPRVRIWSEQVEDGVRLWVEDNGIGIDSASQRRLFGMFQRLHAGQEYHGTGIGLAIVRKAIERMGGKVGVESEPGKGSRFWLQLRRGDS